MFSFFFSLFIWFGFVCESLTTISLKSFVEHADNVLTFSLCIACMCSFMIYSNFYLPSYTVDVFIDTDKIRDSLWLYYLLNLCGYNTKYTHTNAINYCYFSLIQTVLWQVNDFFCRIPLNFASMNCIFSKPRFYGNKNPSKMTLSCIRLLLYFSLTKISKYVLLISNPICNGMNQIGAYQNVKRKL